MEVFSAYTNKLEYQKGAANGNADFLSCLPQPATDADRTGSNRLTSLDTVGVNLIRPCGFTPYELSMAGRHRLGWARTNSLPCHPGHPTNSFTDDGDDDMCRLGPSKYFSGPVSASEPFVGPISTTDNAAGSLAKSTNCVVDAGAPPGLAFRPPSNPRTASWTLALLLAWLSGRPSSHLHPPLAPQL